MRPGKGRTMSTDEFLIEIRTVSGTHGTVRCGSADELLDRLRETLDVALLSGSFAIGFAGPAAPTLRSSITATVLQLVRKHHDAVGDDEWLDDRVEQDGWGGPRVTIDPVFEPCFAGTADHVDERHCGLWVDGQTFLHLELEGLVDSRRDSPSWCTPLVELGHWHPDVGTWAHDLYFIVPGALLQHRSVEEDGRYFTVTPLPDSPRTIARTIADFVRGVSLDGMQAYLVSLFAHGFPTDGSSSAILAGWMTETDDPDFELSYLLIDPPIEARDELRELGLLDSRSAAEFRSRILSNIDRYWDNVSLSDLPIEWQRLVAELDEVAR